MKRASGGHQPARVVLAFSCRHLICEGREVCMFSALEGEGRGTTLPVAQTLAECCAVETTCAYLATSWVFLPAIGVVQACEGCAAKVRLLEVAR